MVVSEGKIASFIENHRKQMRPNAFAHKMERDYELIQTGKKVLSVIMP